MAGKKFLTTGQFAKLCDTTKETLFHYDRLGLLKPKYVSANGYRRYVPEQFFEFDLIWVLKDAGSSLQDIKGYLATFDVGHFLSTMEEKRQELKEQQKRLARRLESLEHILEVTRSALTENYGQIKIERHKPATLLVTKVDPLDGAELSWDDTAEYLSDHFSRCERWGLTNIFPIGGIIPQRDLLAGTFVDRYFFSTVPSPLPPEAPTLTKPGGRYATVLFKGGDDALVRALPGILAEIEGRGLKVAGHAYVYALLSYLSSREEQNDVHRVMIQIR